MQIGSILISTGLAFVVQTQPSFAQSTPSAADNQARAGQWELSVDMKGLPMGDGLKTGKACIKPEALAQGQEKAMIEAAMSVAQQADSNKKDGPKCNFTDIQKDANGSSWTSSCEGPRGPMQGKGSGIITPENAQITQTFEVSLPFGKRTLSQSVAAKRLGECV